MSSESYTNEKSRRFLRLFFLVGKIVGCEEGSDPSRTEREVCPRVYVEVDNEGGCGWIIVEPRVVGRSVNYVFGKGRDAWIVRNENLTLGRSGLQYCGEPDGRSEVEIAHHERWYVWGNAFKCFLSALC